MPGIANDVGPSITDISIHAGAHLPGPTVRPGADVSGPTAAQSVLGRLQPSVINPVVRLAWDLGIPISGDALLETTGRRIHLPRRTPVCDGLEGETFWLIAQSVRDAEWAHILDDDDPRERQRILSQANLARRLCMSTSKVLNTNPLTIRVDLDSA